MQIKDNEIYFMVILCIIRTCTPDVSFCLLFRLILTSGYKVGWSLLGLTSVLRFPDIWDGSHIPIIRFLSQIVT